MQPQPVIVKEFPSLLDLSECRRFCRELREELSDAYRPHVVFDLSRVQHMTAQGIDLLVRCIDQIADRDGELKFAAGSPQTQLVLELTQISGLADSYESVEDAAESWMRAARGPAAPEAPTPSARSA